VACVFKYGYEEDPLRITVRSTSQKYSARQKKSIKKVYDVFLFRMCKEHVFKKYLNPIVGQP